MNSHRSHLIAGSLLLIVVVVACSLSPAGSSPNSTATNLPAGQAPATNAPATNPPASGGCTNAYFPTSSGSTWS